MALSPLANYPSTRSYVLKIHRDAVPAQGRLFGRLESLSSGHQYLFETADELLACIARTLPPAALRSAPMRSESRQCRNRLHRLTSPLSSRERGKA
jgi:hypothetical protein